MEKMNEERELDCFDMAFYIDEQKKKSLVNDTQPK